MSNEMLIILIGVVVLIVVVILGVLVALYLRRKRHTQRLQEKFGPEYEYTMEQIGDRNDAEAELEQREERVKALSFRDLETDERVYFSEEWEQTQAEFVDSPSDAVERADQLVKELLNARGFPMNEFEQRAADISVIFPEVVPNYRDAHEIATKNWRDEASTEELKQAMVHFRTLFSELLETKKTSMSRNIKEIS